MKQEKSRELRIEKTSEDVVTGADDEKFVTILDSDDSDDSVTDYYEPKFISNICSDAKY